MYKEYKFLIRFSEIKNETKIRNDIVQLQNYN